VEKVFDRLCWVHLDYSQPDAAEWLENIDWLNPIIKDNLVDDDTRPRSFTGPSELFLSLRGVNLNPGAEPEDMIAVRLWSNDQCIITSNRRKLQSLEDVREALGKGTGPCSAAQFVSLLVERLALRAESVIEQIEDSFDALEDSLETSDETEHRSEISQIRRQAIRLRRFLAPQREALEHLLEDAPVWIGKSDKAYIKESINRFKRYVEELDAVRDRAIVAQEELLSKFSET
jgi:zinc transporter